MADDHQIGDERGSRCYRITRVFAPGRGEPLEVTGFLCGRLGDPCVQCGDVSEVLCDFPIGEEERTCDKPLCLRCAPEVGVDKNYCTEHTEAGPGLLLFRRSPRADELSVEHEANKHLVMKRAPRIQKTPPAGKRWREVSMGGIALSCWTDEVTARRWVDSRGVRGERTYVQTWEVFVQEWRRAYPLKKRKSTRPRVASGNKPHVTLDGEDPGVQGGVKGICHAEHQPPLED